MLQQICHGSVRSESEADHHTIALLFGSLVRNKEVGTYQFKDMFEAGTHFQVISAMRGPQVIEAEHFLPPKLTQQRHFVQDKPVEVMVVMAFEE
jgi:hypothetical protein